MGGKASPWRAREQAACKRVLLASLVRRATFLLLWAGETGGQGSPRRFEEDSVRWSFPGVQSRLRKVDVSGRHRSNGSIPELMGKDAVVGAFSLYELIVVVMGSCADFSI